MEQKPGVCILILKQSKNLFITKKKIIEKDFYYIDSFLIIVYLETFHMTPVKCFIGVVSAKREKAQAERKKSG
jgi:hypothetical protein